MSALLAWLAARHHGGAFLLRLEDLDRHRCRPEYVEALPRALGWLGLDWDALATQSQHADRHAAALDTLALQGRLYACQCSRAQLRAHGQRAADGGITYPNTCRHRLVARGQWQQLREPLRVRLPDGPVQPCDLGGLDLSQNPAMAMGDPVVRRRDGAVAYQLAVVVDDAAWGVTCVVRGRDIAPSTATQVVLQRLLGLAEPTYRHHLLLCEARGAKLAKLHGSIDFHTLCQHYSGPQLCGVLAHQVGLLAAPHACRPADLVANFSWQRVRQADCTVTWDGAHLQFGVAREPPLQSLAKEV